MSDETTLLPCPFCGGKATVTEFNHGCIISCENDAKAWINGKDNVDGHLAHIQSRSKAEAIAAWNTRAELGSGTCSIESKIFIEGEYAPDPYYEYEMECGGSFKWDDSEPPKHCPECGKAVTR